MILEPGFASCGVKYVVTGDVRPENWASGHLEGGTIDLYRNINAKTRERIHITGNDISPTGFVGYEVQTRVMRLGPIWNVLGAVNHSWKYRWETQGNALHCRISWAQKLVDTNRGINVRSATDFLRGDVPELVHLV